MLDRLQRDGNLIHWTINENHSHITKKQERLVFPPVKFVRIFFEHIYTTWRRLVATELDKVMQHFKEKEQQIQKDHNGRIHAITAKYRHWNFQC